MKEAWMFEAHVDQGAVTSETISDAIADSVSAKYSAWQEARVTATNSASAEQSLERSRQLGEAEVSKARSKVTAGCSHSGGQEWAYPQGMTTVNSGNEGFQLIVEQIEDTLKNYKINGALFLDPAKNMNKEPNAWTTHTELPDVGDEGTWGIKCGKMYEGCGDDGKCGVIIRAINVRSGNCSLPRDGAFVFTRVGVLEVPNNMWKADRENWRIPSHGKLVVGFGSLSKALLGDDANGEWPMPTKDSSIGTEAGSNVYHRRRRTSAADVTCKGAEKEQYMNNMDSAIREGIAKGRFLLGKKIEEQIFKLKRSYNTAGHRRRRTCSKVHDCP